MPFTEKGSSRIISSENLRKRGGILFRLRNSRDSLEEPLLIPNLIRALQKINKSAGIGDEEIHKVLNEIKLARTGSEGSKKVLNFYRFGIPAKFDREKVVKYVRLFDFENPEEQ